MGGRYCIVQECGGHGEGESWPNEVVFIPGPEAIKKQTDQSFLGRDVTEASSPFPCKRVLEDRGGLGLLGLGVVELSAGGW